jgi:GH25 family lysozyme M1 (1,4-beta-N-acetylmuramidase)
MGVRAIDVSRWQGAINWPAVRDDGVYGAWIKVGGADEGYYRDSKATANLNGAASADVPFGTYYFCAPSRGDAIMQARHAVQCGHGRGALWPAADVESNPYKLTLHEMDRWVTDFCHEVQRLTGRESLVYTYSGAGLVGYTNAAPSHCRLWVANYGTNTPSPRPPTFNPGLPPAWREWSVWQFNSTTLVPGIVGNVDQNVVTDAFWAEMTGGTTPDPVEEDDMPVETHILITRPGSQWFTEHGGEPGKQAMFKALNTDQFVRNMGPAEVEGHNKLHAFIEATGGKSGLKVTGEVDDWVFSDRTLLPREWPAPTTAPATVVSLTPEQVADVTAKLVEALDLDPADLAAATADLLADRLND